MEKNRITLGKIRQKKEKGEKIVMVTAYDYPSAQLAESAGVDMILVGDSLGMVVLGYQTTLQVNMEDMIHHTRAVARGCSVSMVVGDLPFLSYNITPEEALRNAGRLIQEGEAQAVKLEGGKDVVPAIQRITRAGIPVMGHLGFTPQSIHQLSGFTMQGKTAAKAKALLEDAKALEDAGAFAVVLELVPVEVAGEVSSRISIPTIGIGSGPLCDGQVQVYHDLLGLLTSFAPRHAKKYAEVGDVIRGALKAYATDVRHGVFPGEAQGRRMDSNEITDLQRLLGSEGEK